MNNAPSSTKRRRARREPEAGEFEAAVRYLESEGFRCKQMRYGPKVRCDLTFPDARRGIRLPEWRVVEIAEQWRAERS